MKKEERCWIEEKKQISVSIPPLIGVDTSEEDKITLMGFIQYLFFIVRFVRCFVARLYEANTTKAKTLRRKFEIKGMARGAPDDMEIVRIFIYQLYNTGGRL